MARRCWIEVAVLALAVALLPAGAGASTPGAGTVSATSPGASWQGGPFLLSNPAACLSSGLVVPGCDRFDLTIAPLAGSYIVEISTEPATPGDDYDLFVYDSAGTLVDSSATASGAERVSLSEPPAGTYTVVVQAFLVTANSTYRGAASLRSVPEDELARAYHGTRVGPGFTGVPVNEKAKYRGTPLSVRATYVGRDAAEPTVGVLESGTAFYAAGAFDALPDGSPRQLARTEILRSRDGGLTWQSVQPQLILGDTTEPPTSLDPYVYVEEESGRVFSIDLYAACSWLLYSDDEGDTWQRNVAACGDLVNDHQTVFSGPPPPGVTTQGFPEVIYYCFNRVADTSCGRSVDGGKTFLPTGDPAYIGVDPEAGGVCGGLTGHLVSDSKGRVFLPKGHCSFPWVSISENGGDTWRRVRISNHLGSADTQTAMAVDSADNVYAVWFDPQNRLPYLATSTDHGATWSVPLMIAPPGVHEVNFPTIIAGDHGRIAVTFPGSTSRNRSDQRRPWNFYTVVSTNALDANPVFVWTTGNDPADPIHRGDCGPGRCGGMFDFLDVVVSPVDGGIWATATDTCMGTCVNGDGASNAMAGMAVRQTRGPSLWAPERKKK